jgi:hypothetical protein
MDLIKTSSPQVNTVNLGLQRKLSVVLFLAVALVMGGRGYLNYIQTVQLQHKQVAANLNQLESTFLALKDRSSEELFRLADQQSIPSQDEFSSDSIQPPSLLSGIDSIYYLSKDGTVLGRSVQDGASIQATKAQISKAVSLLNDSQRPIAALNCILQCFQSVYIPIIADDGRELIININRSATLLIQDFYEITGADIALLAINQEDGILTAERIIAASHAKTTSRNLSDIFKFIDFNTRAPQNFFDTTPNGYFSARFFPISHNSDITSYAAVIKDQSQVEELL